ncbi:MAG: ATP-binding cassette domain-containing protein [Candidatus Hydrogenedens sp.]|nr:ATP-binding cassette domain-containing protein [Candidatus Hydrogenedens sp.]
MSFEVQSGEIFGYLGPNGSGKTTTIKMLLGLIFPTSGKIRILGSEDITSNHIRMNIGYLPEGAYYPDFLRGEEILKYYGQLYGLSGADLRNRIDAVIDLVGMSHARKRLMRGYSKGMRQRIGLAQALISDPKILILDEPTTGLDPIARKEIRDILARLRDEGKTLMISSHELMEVELISNRISIIYEGDMKVHGTIDELLVDREVVVEVTDLDEPGAKQLEERGLTLEDAISGRARVRVPEGMDVYNAIEICRSAGARIGSIAPRRETLEELFVRVVGGASRAKAEKAA